ncbi:ATPase family associated with various cellular activities (AAA) [Seinonella peptonophila]|uniref:ATPase family associated with various cellular activities (AAA) n=1 Tax=Seinonella peptonophila TaxID=112248 RepID=A0A1M4X0N3_9BACL|nr:AAA family ATPase [Seinonella peptonophila]SHE86937.1 ATPase family associated with various cellular activities (AAA) [Seinonella peptonophila]
MNKEKGTLYGFFGIPGSGKTTIANRLRAELHKQSIPYINLKPSRIFEKFHIDPENPTKE